MGVCLHVVSGHFCTTVTEWTKPYGLQSREYSFSVSLWQKFANFCSGKIIMKWLFNGLSWRFTSHAITMTPIGPSLTRSDERKAGSLSHGLFSSETETEQKTQWPPWRSFSLFFFSSLELQHCSEITVYPLRGISWQYQIWPFGRTKIIPNQYNCSKLCVGF